MHNRLTLLALVCVGLTLVTQTHAGALDGDLPPVVSTDSGLSSAPVETKSSNGPDSTTAVEPEAAPTAKDSSERPVAGESKKNEAPAESTDSSNPKAPELSGRKDGSETSQNSASETSNKPPAQSGSNGVKLDEKDLKSLLENKNDAENDLVLPPADTKDSGPAKPSATAGTSEEVPIIPATAGDKVNDDRFHYSLGGVAGSEKQPSEGKQGTTISGSKEVSESAHEESKHDESDQDDQEDSAGADSTKATAEGSVDKADKRTDEPAATTTTETVKEPSGGDRYAASSTESTKPEGGDSGEKAATDKQAAWAGAMPASPGEPAEKKESSVQDGAQAGDSKPKAESPAEPSSKPNAAEQPPTPEASPNSKQPSLTEAPQASTTTTTTSTVAPVTSTAVPATTKAATTPAASTSKELEAKLESTQQSAVAAASAAAGSAFGSAVGSALATGLGNKDQKPAISSSPAASASTTTSTSTTRAPEPSSGTTTTRRSFTNRWNSWSTSSTSPPASNRRRLPPVPSPPQRRRFRPYNRFPWAMPEPYSPLDPMLPPAEVEPDFSPASEDASPTAKPRRRSSSTTSTLKPSTSSSDEHDEEVPVVSTRRRAPESNGGSSTDRHRHKHHHHRHHTNRHHNRDRSQPDGHVDRDQPTPTRRRHHHRPSRDDGFRRWHKNQDDTFASLDPFQTPNARPQTPLSGFGLFNSAAGSSAAGSGFDLLNPFSWLDEVTKPRPPGVLHNRPQVGLDQGNGGQPFAVTPSHVGRPGRPLGSRPVPFEGEFGGADSASADPQHHDHDHHQHNHRPHGRPAGGSGHGRDDYYDEHHDCHGHGHDHEHDYDRDRDHDHNSGRPYRPPYRPTRPGRDDYDEYGSSRPSRPIGGGYGGRPYGTRSGESETSSSGRESERPTQSQPRSGLGERLESGDGNSPSSATPSAGPRRLPSSVFSPFDTLFGSLDDDLFGGLKSSFIDAPLKAAADTIRRTASSTALADAIVSSPKISTNKETGDGTARSGRIIISRGEKNEPASFQSAGKPQQQVSSGLERKSALGEPLDRIESLQERRRDQSPNGTDQIAASEPKQADEELDRGRRQRVELPPPITTLRGGIKHFLLMI